MAKNSFLEWDTTASNNTDIAGIGILGTNAVSNFDDAFRTLMAQLRSGVDGEMVYATKSGNYTALANDNNAFIRFSAAATLTLTAASTLGANWHLFVVANGGDVVIDPNASETIDGKTTLTVRDGSAVLVICDGTNFKTNLTADQRVARGLLNGLTLSNNGSDATNDIDIATGEAASDGTTPHLMILASALTKRLDAAWAVGTGNGGLDTGAIANGTYHIYLIQRSDTGVVDAAFSTSATAPTIGGNIPAAYDRWRLIGSIIRSGGSISGFRQFGRRFLLNTSVQNRNDASAAANILVTVSVPGGRRFRPILSNQLVMNAASSATTAYGDGDSGATNTICQGVTSSQIDIITIDHVYTNTSQQIRYSASISAGSISSNILTGMGWYDDLI